MTGFNTSYYCYRPDGEGGYDVWRFKDATRRGHFAAANGCIPCTAAFVAANLGVPRQAMLVTARHLWRKVETTHGPALAFDWAALEECYRDW